MGLGEGAPLGSALLGEEEDRKGLEVGIRGLGQDRAAQGSGVGRVPGPPTCSVSEARTDVSECEVPRSMDQEHVSG